HDTVPVEVPATVEVSAASDGDRHLENAGVTLGDEVGAGLAGVVGVPAHQRRVLVVGATIMVAVGFVRRGRHHLLDLGAPPARFEDGPRPGNVALERRDRVASRNRHDGLRREMDDRVDLVLAMVCAARWMTVSISYSPSARSRSAWSRTSPRTTLTCLRS